MGIPNLWPELSSSATTTTLPIYCLTSFTTNTNTSRGLRLGIDASLWLFHAQQSSGGSNPYLRLLFYRLAKLLTLPVLPLFVFDGSERPTWKRGKQVKGKQHAIEHPFTQLIEAFGFQWCRARGEAEAELAWLNTEGVVDAVLTDDSDALLFGAQTVVRNWGRNLSGTKAFNRTTSGGSDVFQDEESSSTTVGGGGGLQLTGSDRDLRITLYKASDMLSHPDLGLDQNGLILIALMSGGDYDTTGLLQCGVKIAIALARGGFGTSLISAFKSSYPTLTSAAQTCFRFASFLSTWLEEVREELRTNNLGFLPSRRPKLASTIKDSFLATPESRRVLAFYVYPLTSNKGSSVKMEGKGGEPDLQRLASLVQLYFQWSKEAILGKFRRVLGPGVVVRRLRQQVVEVVDGGGSEGPWGALVDSPSSKGVRRYRLGLAAPNDAGEEGGKEGKEKPMHESPNATRITDFFSRTAITSQLPTTLPRVSMEGAQTPTLDIKAIRLQRRHAALAPFLDYRCLVSVEEFALAAEKGIDASFDAELKVGRTQQDGESETEVEDVEDGPSRGGKVDDGKEPLLMWIPEPLLQLSVSGGDKLQSFIKDLERKNAAKSAKKPSSGAGGGGKKGQMSLMSFVKPGAKPSLSSMTTRSFAHGGTTKSQPPREEPMTPRTSRQLRIPSGLMRRTESVPLLASTRSLGLGRRRGVEKITSMPANPALEEGEGDSSIEFLGELVSSSSRRNERQVHSRPSTPPTDDSSEEGSSSNKSPRKSKTPAKTVSSDSGRGERRDTPSQRALAEPSTDEEEGMDNDKGEIIPPRPTRLFGATLASAIRQNAKPRKPRISAITISEDSDNE
ncbi:hypothetical protein NDA11_006921 [Ustilago hordei]|uniref:XPG-I domain-containing protein n=1 Tax=Ustilago hordei TaxID=120017 RepID=I2FZU7_USTHO|nr:uncharacterized protein UHO2_03768 [Ustilago hordei]KAJ1043985.1 hypothetical protein NDA10_002450 [Ustilago hordei]KAJ1578821.1 hypothetical protein NDA15_000020 [Ustilago hordei]KAJ1580749.1 hypothetical protein NDA12_005713 [Ustilago hordei]KAJ1581622.1 hypothetical protein NDA11_006921 [Ustilago hordei]KAJ1597235.1 hypothetical protein NDA14_001569 [Ustilago hordei]